ncbi:unnamed protein product [Trifolium pratense]|uniref:Uncharacterized protein n=1 Tax=Trifolium pratense TaxID=57577 RepID=A0ACB0J7R3_TRIPR|nr:unnamed protein product [Trifolium pratense]
MSIYKAYTILMNLELASIGIKYQVATMADMNLPATMIIFHISGVVGCETLLWILLPEFWNWYIINLFLLMATTFCFFNYILSIIKLFLPTQSNAAIAHLPNPVEPQTGV